MRQKAQGKKKLHLLKRDTIFLSKTQEGLGIRNYARLNLALMTKLGWKISQAHPNLAQECIHAKYIHKNHVTQFKNGSPTWKNIRMGWELLRKECEWSLGDEKSIWLWNENWLDIGSIRSLVEGPLMEKEDKLVVSELTVGGIGT